MTERRSQLASQATAELPSSAFNIPAGWREAIAEIRNGLNDATPSAFDNSGYRDYAGIVLDAVEEELSALAAAPTHPVDAVPGEPVASARKFIYEDHIRPEVSGGDESFEGLSWYDFGSSRMHPCVINARGRTLLRDGDWIVKIGTQYHAFTPEVYVHLAASVASRAGSEPVTLPERNALLRQLVAEVERLQALFSNALYPDRERAAWWTIIAPDGWKFTGEKPMNLILEASRHEREIDPVEADRQDMRLMAAIDEEMAEHKRDRAELVNRFLRWPLPKTVFTDAGTGTVEPSKRPENWSASGTNLLTAEEATAMLAFVLDCDEGDRELAQREVDRASAGEAQS